MPLTRREFIKGSAALVLASSVPVWMRCSPDTGGPLSRRQAAIARRVMQIILPDDELGPGADAIHALEFLRWTLSDPFYDPDIQRLIVKGIDDLDRRAKKMHGRSFTALDAEAQAAMVNAMAEEGDGWLSRMISVVLEALLSDPIYGGNVEKAGWHWLHHYEGKPRPDAKTRYEVLMQKRHGGHV